MLQEIYEAASAAASDGGDFRRNQSSENSDIAANHTCNLDVTESMINDSDITSVRIFNNVKQIN